MIGRGSPDPRESLSHVSAARRLVEPALGPWMQPSDRLVRVLAEGLRSIAERSTREETERRNRVIIVPRTDGGTSHEATPDP
jgi:hypothetical protein